MGLEIMDDVRKDFVRNMLSEGDREDGRGFREYREISLKRDIINKAEGSACVKLGDTEVLVGAKLEIGSPFPDSPTEGVLITNAELVPLASPEFESGPPNEKSIQLARVVDRGIRGSGVIDVEKLCIEEGEKVWILFLDIHVLDNNGNLIDAAALGAIAALQNIRVPNERYGLTGEDTLQVHDTPVDVTMVEIDGTIVVDPTCNEENAATNRLTVISNADGSLSGLQKAGSDGMKEETIVEMVGLGIEKAGEIREKFLKVPS
ncbi:MAG: Exosome complex component Rrp42 [Candidatus Methanophagaceae archaeon]|nr:MAG: Exosome complex component Rrp42 [Methanophagales archaeon]KAF5436334.1 exosome complex component RRP42 [Methanophagales archaeon]